MIFLLWLKPQSSLIDTHDPGGYHQAFAEELRKKKQQQDLEKAKEILAKVSKEMYGAAPKETKIYELENQGIEAHNKIVERLNEITDWLRMLDSIGDELEAVEKQKAKEALQQQQAELEYQANTFMALIMDDELLLLSLLQ
jgi:hypothetical protein